MEVWPRTGSAHHFPPSSSDARGDEILGVAGAVVVGIDGSAADDAVVDWAADEAARLEGAAPPGQRHRPGGADDAVRGARLGGAEPGRAARRGCPPAPRRGQCPGPVPGTRGLDVAVDRAVGPAAAALVRLSEGALRVVVGGPTEGPPGTHPARVGRPAGRGARALPGRGGARRTPSVDDSPPHRRRRSTAARSAAAPSRSRSATAEVCGASVTCVLGWHVEVHEGVVVTERSSERWAAVEQRYLDLGHRTLDPVAARHPAVDVDVTVRHGAPATAPSSRRPPSWTPTSSSSGSRGLGRLPRAPARLGEPPRRRARGPRGRRRALSSRPARPSWPLLTCGDTLERRPVLAFRAVPHATVRSGARPRRM